MLGTVNINGKTYEYTLEYKKIRNFNMRIRRDGSIYVSAPKSVSLKSVENFVLSNSKFIVRSVERFNIRMQNESDSEKFFDGCVKRIFGEDYILRFAVGDCREVRKEEKILWIYSENSELNIYRDIFENWAEREFSDTIYRLCGKVYSEFEKYNLQFPKIRIKKMVSRWGSCNPVKNIVTFNRNLLPFSEDCIKYVVYHEFSHFIYRDHSKKFYNFLEEFCPDWKIYRKILNKK